MSNHYKKEPAYSDRYFYALQREDPIDLGGKAPAAVTPLEQFLEQTEHQNTLKDIWEQHKALLSLGHQLRWGAKVDVGKKKEAIPPEWLETPTKRRRHDRFEQE
jgi:hypothetical protein